MAAQFSKLSDSEVKAIEALDQILDESGNTFSVWSGKALAAMVAVARFTGWLASKPMQTADALMRGDKSFFVTEAAAWGVSETEDTTAADAAKREAQKRAAEAAKVVEAQKLVDDAKKIEDEQALKSLPLEQQIARLESDRAQLAKIISSAKATDVDRAKAMLGHAKVGVELAEKQKRLQDEITKGKATEAAQQAQINTLRERAANARQNLAATRHDFTRWGLEELAQQPNNLPNTRAAREAVRQLEFARIGTMIGGPVGERLEKFHLGNYETLVKQNPALRSSDRDPFKPLLEANQQAAASLAALEKGVKVTEIVTGE